MTSVPAEGATWRKKVFRTLWKSVRIVVAREFRCGEHIFDFELRVPNSTTPGQRDFAWRVEHSVTASLAFADSCWTTLDSAKRPVYLAALRSDPGEVPEAYNFFKEHHSQALGPLRLQVSSPGVVVGALIHVRVHLASPVKKVFIRSIHSSLRQEAALYDIDSTTTRATTQPVAQLPPIHLPIPIIDESGVKPVELQNAPNTWQELMEGTWWDYESFMRLPKCSKLRPSSIDGGDARIIINHHLTFEIRYKIAEGIGSSSEQSCIISFPIEVGTVRFSSFEAKATTTPRKLTHGCVENLQCLSVEESLILPPYSEAKPDVVMRKQSFCVCEFTLEELLDRHRDALLRAACSEESDSGRLKKYKV
ncbi:hypothetical protein P7C70_g3240, partial [Phenoliferia sp. Uapishka_3]